MILQVDRSKWSRGEGHSKLLRRDGRLCIFGFLALACGLTPEQILFKPTIAGAANDGDLNAMVLAHPILSQLVIECYNPSSLMSSKLAYEIMAANDERDPAQAEERITSLLAHLGITVEFVN